MSLKKLFLGFVTTFIAQFSFAVIVTASVSLVSAEVQRGNRVIDGNSETLPQPPEFINTLLGA